MRLILATLMSAAGLLAVLPAAQAQTPRNGNVYNGTAHQPTQAGVVAKERSAGLPTPDGTAPHAGEVDQLGRQLLHDEAVDPPRSPTPQPVPPAPR